MPITRPYRRTCRAFWDGHYAEGGRWRYIQHPRFAQTPGHYIRAVLLLLKDLQGLFDYVSPPRGISRATRFGSTRCCCARASRWRPIARPSFERITIRRTRAGGRWPTIERSIGRTVCHRIGSSCRTGRGRATFARRLRPGRHPKSDCHGTWRTTQPSTIASQNSNKRRSSISSTRAAACL